MENYHLNVAVARLMELVSAIRKAIDSGPGAADPAVREGAEALAVMLSLFAPYTAEECWEALGGLDRVGPDGIPSVARAPWPAADPALLVQETVTCVVQVNGKVRDRLEVSPDITEAELRELALAAAGAARALTGLGIQRVVVRPAEAGQHRRRIAEGRGTRHTRRSTATTLPRMAASSPRIGVKAGLCGISQTCPSLCLSVFTVASPSIMAATISPFSASLLLPDDHPVAVGDGRVDHRVACHLEHEQGALAD